MPETIQDLMPETPDLNQERLAELKRLMPDIFTDEGNLDEKQLRQIIEFAKPEDQIPKTAEKYEFNWFGKAKAKQQAYEPTRLTLQYDPERSFNAENSENVIIEGENLEVLKLLLCGYRGKIKCIYIDPPYNTGKDFVYSDKHATEYKEYLEKTGKMREGIKTDANADTSGRYHSDWLSMMYSRLIVAQQLLKKDGVIFISIDDNEVHNLRKLCDEVFGADNFLANVIWQKKYSPQNDAKYFSGSHEHILTYAKSLDDFTIGLLKRTEEANARYRNPDNDPRGDWKPSDITRQEFRPNDDYKIVSPKTGKTFSPPAGNSWGRPKEKIEELIIDNRIWFGPDGNSIPSLKRFLTEVKQGITPQTIWERTDVGDTQEGKRLIKTIFGNTSIFETAKPFRLIQRVLEVSNFAKDDLVLDFFGGSGTTGQAIYELNLEDDGKRKFILVQLPEGTDEKSEPFKAGYKKISDITIERNKRVAKKLSTDDAPVGFKVFTLEKSYFPRTEWTPEPGMDEAAKLASLRAYIEEKEGQQTLAYDQDKLLTEVLIKEGFKLTYKAVRRDDFTENTVYNVTDGEREATVCLDSSLTDATVKQLRQLIDKRVVVIERALDTTKKWNLHNSLGEKFRAF